MSSWSGFYLFSQLFVYIVQYSRRRCTEFSWGILHSNACFTFIIQPLAEKFLCRLVILTSFCSLPLTVCFYLHLFLLLLLLLLLLLGSVAIRDERGTTLYRDIYCSTCYTTTLTDLYISDASLRMTMTSLVLRPCTYL